jgi:hypothetical protein
MKLLSLLRVGLLLPPAVSSAGPADPANYLTDFAQLAAVRWPKNRTLTIVSHGHSVPAGYTRAGLVRTFDAYQLGLIDSLAAFDRAVAGGTKLDDLLAQNNHPNRAGHEIVARELLGWFPPPLTPPPNAKPTS